MEQITDLDTSVDDDVDLDADADPRDHSDDSPPDAIAIVQNEEDLQAERLALLGVPPPIKVHEYFSRDEELRQPVELVFGAIRRIAPLCPEFQPLLGRLMRRVSAYVELKGVGQAHVTPMEVVLSVERSLVVRPHMAVVLNTKRDIVRDPIDPIRQVIWGAPHVVIEFAWAPTSRRLHTMKTRWYRFYGVQELWCIDPRDKRIELLDMMSNPGVPPHIFRGSTPIHSRMLPKIALCADHIFGAGEEEDTGEAYVPNTNAALGFV
jgi:Uma2 family endonuclease